MRALAPVPFTCARSTPISRANLRTEGLAYAFEKPSSLNTGASLGLRTIGASRAAGSVGGSGGAMGAGAVVVGAGAAAAAGTSGDAGGCAAVSLAAAGGAAGAAASSFARTVATRSPGDTLLDFETWTFSMTPPTVDGTSIAAFSVSSVTSGASASMLSPGFTSTSMTATSLKSPMS